MVKKTILCKYLEGNYPIPMLITWNKPNVDIMKQISNIDANELQNEINNNLEKGFLFIANPDAYIWYDNNKKIIDLQYNRLENIIWLIHIIKPTNSFLLHDDKKIHDLPFIKFV